MIIPRQVWLAIEPVDMRLGIDGLSLRVQEALGRAPCDGSAVAFRNTDKRWLVSVAMVSEGVDIKRLRVLVYLPNAMTELCHYFTNSAFG